ncbi:P-loop containing nucleoside triphosphate hydrolase protein [Favolaschia claudopus]|uniref:P-loop containing nucleoside triphosphate hydrolase protein n=1 Tax=Favolaschia claudopus TaxID=2862362 RepID=A0AAW0BFL1_9AGAR
MSIVPQIPQIFEGTLRQNLDPMGKHDDVDIWVTSLSAGQKQPLSLARAMLRRSKILVLDEGVPYEIIQGPAFEDTTIITIAHRLNTIIGCSRILVMHEGQVAEFDNPQNLLGNSNSLFFGLAKEAGLVY